eukprot:CAMPEP_0170554926 /NCGR_PEP_ID=MMETSP0211-20121228/12804_1 /TAXON_ID=311385 /ORGANISM="Pseudokeronopsis sp., Strain OXSARD2" /LENGTH=146 /DNA_ID=CAMNT_0010864369 /DNA_START=1568 /DNA_END=2008 /DNA_ORIENTATION=+
MMQQKKGVNELEAGTFFIDYLEFTKLFKNLHLCRDFNNEFEEFQYSSEWSNLKNTAGGCTNYDSCGNNPQLALTIEESKCGEIDVFINLRLEDEHRLDEGSGFAFGFGIYDLKGRKVMNKYEKELFNNDGGHKEGYQVSYDGKMKG